MTPDRAPRWSEIVIAIVLAPAVAIHLAFKYLYDRRYSPSTFRGDGEVQDTGFWGYPRYRIRFSEVRLDVPGRHTFRCSGLPPVQLGCYLAILGDHHADSLANLGTKVEVHVTDDRGRERCRGSGTLSQWALHRSGERGEGFWPRAFQEVLVDRNRAYTIHLTVGDVDTASPVLWVRPTLQGGGVELP